jgi:hypothetical protein
MTHKWPDGTPKSMHNSFNWRDNSLGILCAKPTPTPARSKDMHSNGSIYSYAKAKTRDTTPHTITKHGKGKMFTINKEIP